MSTAIHSGPLFALGQTVATPGALEFCRENNVEPVQLLARHHHGDWGDLDFHDTLANEEAIEDGDRIFSSYKVAGEKVWVITEADRSATTVLLPSEY